MHIVCHMAASVDGRLRPSRWSPFVEDCSVAASTKRWQISTTMSAG